MTVHNLLSPAGLWICIKRIKCHVYVQCPWHADTANKAGIWSFHSGDSKYLHINNHHIPAKLASPNEMEHCSCFADIFCSSKSMKLFHIFHITMRNGVYWATQDCWVVDDATSEQAIQRYQTQVLPLWRVRHLITDVMLTITHSHYLVYVGTNWHAAINLPDCSADSSELATCCMAF